MVPGMPIVHSHLALARCQARAGAVTHFLGCSPSNPAVGTALSRFYKGAEGRDVGRSWVGRVVADAVLAAAWAADVGPAGGRSPVGGAVPAMTQMAESKRCLDATCSLWGRMRM